jgi:hypothetical protein
VPSFAEFLDGSRFVVVFRPTGRPWAVQTWDAESGEQRHQFTLPELDPAYDDFVPRFAVSPGRRYLAFGTADGALRLFELATGRQVAALDLGKPPGRYLAARALQFSPDGRELAGWYKFGETGPGEVPNSRLFCWDLAAGRLLCRHDFQASLSRNVGPLAAHLEPLVWLGDGSGWVAFGRWLIDRESGRVIWALPRPERAHSLALLAPLDGGRLLTGWLVDDSGGAGRVIQIKAFALPREEIGRARDEARAGRPPPVPDLPTARIPDVL